MKLVSFAVRKYRSISSTTKLPIKDSLTVLIGPNNEGKSNLLRALVAALQLASTLETNAVGRKGLVRSFQWREKIYDWDRDFPVDLQATAPAGKSEFDLEFELDVAEIAEFRSEVGSNLNGTLPIRMGIGKEGFSFSVTKRGPGGPALSAKASRIAKFIGKRIGQEHIPAVRPAEAATSIVQEILDRELFELRSDPQYEDALRKIEELQEPVLDAISNSVRDTLKVFLPNVSQVKVQTTREARYRALSRSCEVIVDDGTPTPLSRKGDGVQSLAALSLMRHATQRSLKERNLILAVEEPESHLHPNAIHELRAVLLDIAKQHQVIVTTHCSLFVDRHETNANILVTANRASPARSVQQIRESLGIRVSDNLVSAEVVLLVEGEDDRIAMQALLPHHSKKLGSALRSGLLAIDTLVGGSNLSYKLTQARLAMCGTHSLIDHDLAGKLAVQRAMDEGLLQIADLTYASCLGMQQSEIEDWYDSSVYGPVLKSHFGVPDSHPRYTATNKKWSDRMREIFIASGKPWDDKVEMMVKLRVAEAAISHPDAILLPVRKGAFDTLLQGLESKLD